MSKNRCGSLMSLIHRMVRVLVCTAVCLSILNITGCKSKTEKSDNDSSELLLYTDALNGGSEDDNAGSIKEVIEVKRGDYSYSMNAMGSVAYLDKYYELVPISESRFTGYKVEVGDKVSKGDIIYTYEMDYSEADINQREAEVIQREKDYNAGYNERLAEINKAEHELKELTDDNEIQIKKLEIKKLRLALKEYSASKDDIKKAREELNEFLAGVRADGMKAEHDGYVLFLEELNEEDMLYKGNLVAIISPKKEYYVEVDDISQGKLRYNSEVTIHVDGDEKSDDKTMKGRVIASSNVLSPSNNQDSAYVEVLDEPEGVNWNNPIKISYSSKEMKDVLILPKKAIQYETTDAGSEVGQASYVYIYEDEHAYKRYVEVYDSGGDECVILQGLTEGQQVAVYQ